MALTTTLPMTAAVQTKDWGKTASGQQVHLYTLQDGPVTVRLTSYGARIVGIDTPDRDSHEASIVLGYPTLAEYEADSKTYFGAIVGRYGNRLAGGRFTLDGKTYQVPTNNKGNALHGGTVGFDQKVWTATVEGPSSVEFTLVSPDMDMGFPGQLTVHVRYTLKGPSLRLEYTATTTRPTVLNLTNHAYFNLAGEGNGTILDQKMQIDADRITPVDAGLIPTGKFMDVAGTPFDFRQPTAIGERIGAENEQLKLAGGYDHNFVLNGPMGTLHRAAFAEDPASGRTLTVETTQPGVQFYSGNFLDGSNVGKAGKPYNKHAGFALETQHFPDSPNQPAFPSTTLKPGETFHSTTVLTFGTAH